jgi:hypothetical protein
MPIMEMPGPTEEHQWLQSHAGKWTVQCEMHVAPGAPPMQMQARGGSLAPEGARLPGDDPA